MSGWAAAAAAVANLAGGIIDKNQSASDARWNRHMQYEFAKNSIQWTKQDALAAGLHPLYAMGAQTKSPSPIYTGSSLGDSVAAAGTTVANYIANRDAKKRANEMAELQLEEQRLRNQALKQQNDFISQSATASRNKITQHQVQSKPSILTTPLGNTKTGPHTKAEDWETEYGGAVGEFAGLIRYLNDQDFFNGKKFGKKLYQIQKRIKEEARKSAKIRRPPRKSAPQPKKPVGPNHNQHFNNRRSNRGIR